MLSYHRVGALLFVVGFTIKGLYALGVLNSLGRSSNPPFTHPVKVQRALPCYTLQLYPIMTTLHL